MTGTAFVTRLLRPSISADLPRSQPRAHMRAMATLLKQLRDAIESATSVAEIGAAVEALAPEFGLLNQHVAVQEPPAPGPYAILLFTPPVDARAFCYAMGWEHAYASSGDVHQESWSVRVRTPDLEELYPGHVPTADPELGIWIVRAKLAARPYGDAKFYIGPSAAYDLNVDSATVAQVSLQGWRRDWAVPPAQTSRDTRPGPRWMALVRSWLPW